MTRVVMAAALFSCFLSLYLFLAAAITNNASTTCNIPLGSYINTSLSSSWISTSGDFAFGFKRITTAAFLPAIYYNKIREQSVVWYLNITSTYPQNLVPANSILELTNAGILALTVNGSTRPIWSSNFTENVHCADMRDDGNLVLLSKNDTILWESFHDSTDTLLPGQTMNEGSRLVSRFSESSFATGRFQLSMQEDGNLVLYPIQFPSNADNYAIWASRTDGENGRENDIKLIFSPTKGLFLFQTGTLLTKRQIFNPLNNSFSSYYQRATLNSYGVLVHYVYDKAGSNWTAVAAVPEDICLRITTPTGRGVCGCNGYCRGASPKEASSPGVILPTCFCPTGYVLVDPNDSQGGCVPGFVPQKCGNGSAGYEMKEIVNVDWPLNDLDYFQGVDLKFCKNKCLEDCFCSVAIYKDSDDCWIKRVPLTNGRYESTSNRTALIKVKVGDS